MNPAPIESTERFDRAWMPRLQDLAARIRTAARGALLAAIENGTLDDLMRPHAEGVGDVTYGIDLPTEIVLSDWLEELARFEPVSLLTEDAGWRHLGPDGRGGTCVLPGFDHGGPRIVVDPIDGTRNLMADVRSAWTVIGACGPGADAPRQRDVVLGVLTEIPDSRGRIARELFACAGRGARTREIELVTGRAFGERALHADDDARADHGYFPFFRYMADLRPAIARVESAFFARLAQHEGAEVRNCYDDQYISNGGQLALLSLGKYRMIADLREHLARVRGRATQTSKPYDISGAVVVAREAGCVVTLPDGRELDFPLDAVTPIGFVGWHNEATRARLAPHLSSALFEAVPEP